LGIESESEPYHMKAGRMREKDYVEIVDRRLWQV
jgi:hypothetical protein